MMSVIESKMWFWVRMQAVGNAVPLPRYSTLPVQIVRGVVMAGLGKRLMAIKPNSATGRQENNINCQITDFEQGPP